MNTDDISEEEIIDQVSSQNDGSICVWFHAFRAGRFLNSIPNNLDRSHIVILGGTGDIRSSVFGTQGTF